MKRFVFLIAAWLALNVAVLAQTPSESDKTSFKSIIAHQLEAFARDDGASAYSDAAPFIQRAFPTVDEFMSMVKRGYLPVYRNSKYIFGETGLDPNGRPIQRVIITGLDGSAYEAIYTMQQQEDGSWKIGGCTLAKMAGMDV